MKFGKLENINQVDFSLPEDHLQTQRILNGEANLNPKVFFGCPAWGCKDWVGKIYPPKTKPTDFLNHYSKQFSTIEFNTTHYRIPTKQMVLAWKEKAQNGFKFCPKIPQNISHNHRLSGVGNLVTEFTDSVVLLEEKLGICFVQLHPTFSPKNAKILIQFAQDFPLPLAVEFRHPDWFSGNSETEKTFEELEKASVSAVITDVAGAREVLHTRLTTKTAVIRFVGNELHPTDFNRLDDWAEKLKNWFSQGLEQVYFFLHEPDDVLCPELTEHFIKTMNATLGIELPKLRFYNQEVQGSLF
jgi:uncharacterized protein YecE (DUF72 family)